MNGLKLKMIRELLGLSIAEAAEYIGGVSKRSWEYWEKDDRTLKPDVIEKMNSLLQQYNDKLFTAIEEIKKGKPLTLHYPTTPNTNIIEWRLTQSLVRVLVCCYGAELAK
ncbi:Aca2/YdiL-like domain-containing protein [Lonepinella sp. BR2357]|uniref:Aca2/YdiL-like domain-containing protein n=1 Tax=Lonepinella sp. BR2357 TaxID=3434549 RepID=UPI003F6DE3AD